MATKSRKEKSAQRTRVQRFKAALALRDSSMELWAKENGITYGHLYQVLTGRRPSPPLIARVEEFSANVLGPEQPAALSA